jgi:RNA polymerase sigma-70 factor (ECF subfamily)
MSDYNDIGSFCGEDDAGPDFDVLYRDHAPGLRRRLRARVRSHEEANDLVQDAFARLLGARSLSSIRDPGAFLNRIVRNLLIDRSRRLSARSPHVSIDVGDDIAVAPDQGQAIEVEQMRERYCELVQLLPPRTREVFTLHRIDGHSYKDIAARLDISVRTVEWHIAQAIVRISRGLDGE